MINFLRYQRDLIFFENINMHETGGGKAYKYKFRNDEKKQRKL